MKKLNNKGDATSELLVAWLVVGLIIFSLVATVFGLVLAFKASILLGIIVLLLEPSAYIIGVVYLIGHVNLAQRVMEWLSKR